MKPWRRDYRRAEKTCREAVPGTVACVTAAVEALRIAAIGVAETGDVDALPLVEALSKRVLVASTLAATWRTLAGDAPPPDVRSVAVNEASVLRLVRDARREH